MEHKISSSLTEFYKIYGILFLLFVFTFYGSGMFDTTLDFIFFIILFSVGLFMALDAWRMKDVELTDEGLIISKRFFFSQKTIFVPFENIEIVDHKLWWIGNFARTSVKFVNATEFGNEVLFVAKGYTHTSQIKTVTMLKRNLCEDKKAERLNSASSNNILMTD